MLLRRRARQRYWYRILPRRPLLDGPGRRRPAHGLHRGNADFLEFSASVEQCDLEQHYSQSAVDVPRRHARRPVVPLRRAVRPGRASGQAAQGAPRAHPREQPQTTSRSTSCSRTEASTPTAARATLESVGEQRQARRGLFSRVAEPSEEPIDV